MGAPVTEEDMAEFISDVKIVSYLWSKVPGDCRACLLGELLFNPQALRTRYGEEMRFRRNLESRWS